MGVNGVFVHQALWQMGINASHALTVAQLANTLHHTALLAPNPE
jgi:hypothetical protein